MMRREWGRKLLFVIFGKKRDNPRGWPTHFEFIHKTDEERCENLPWVLGYERRINDLHEGNFGYRGGYKVILDFAGFRGW